MKSASKLTLLLFILTIASPSLLWAKSWQGIGGLQMTQADPRGSSDSADKIWGTGLRLGAVTFYKTPWKMPFRTGFLFSERRFSHDYGSLGSVEVRFRYLDVPLTLTKNIGSSGYIFFGMNLGLLISADLMHAPDGYGDVEDEESFLLQLVAGYHWDYNDKWGLNAYLEQGMGIVYDGAKLPQVIGLAATYNFDN